MNFNANLMQVQGLLKKFDRLHSISKIKSHGDNKKETEELIQSFSSWLVNAKYIKEDSINEEYRKELREICFFIIINSNFKSLKEMTEGDLGHLIGIVPTVPTCLLIDLLIGLNLEYFLLEAIVYCDVKLSVDLINAVIPSLHLIKSEDLPFQLRLLSKAVYHKICQLNFMQMNEEEFVSLIKFLSEKLIVITNFFNTPPNIDTINAWKQNKLYIHAAKTVLSLIELAIDCFNIYLIPLIEHQKKEVEIYLPTYAENSAVFETKTEFKSQILEQLEKCNLVILDTCKSNLVSVNLDMFCCWSEFEYQDGITWQDEIGNKAYNLKMLISKIPSVKDHILGEMLIQFAKEPITLTDVMKNADKETLLKKVSIKDDDQKEWIKELIQRDFVLSDKGCMDCVRNNVNLLTEDDLIKLLNESVSLIQASKDLANRNDVKLLILCLMENINLNLHKGIICNIFDGKYNSIMETDDYSINRTEVFNKFLVHDEINMQKVNVLFVQNPLIFIEKATEYALKSEHHCESILKIFIEIKNYIDDNIKQEHEDALIKNMQVIIREKIQTEKEKLSAIFLLTGFAKDNIINSTDLIIKVLMPCASDLTYKNFVIMSLQIKTLQNVFKNCLDKHLALIAPTLVMLAQVMEVSRWDLLCFDGDAVVLLKECIILQQNLFNYFMKQKNESDKEFKWLKVKLSKLTPLNCYYFNSLWFTDKKSNLYLTLFDENTTNDSKKVIMGLCQVLPQCTMEECKALYENMDVENNKTKIEVMLSVVLAISVAAKQAAIDNAKACLLYCCRNAVVCMKGTIMETNIAVEAFNIFAKILRLIQTFDEEVQKETIVIFLPILSEIVDMSKLMDKENKTSMNLNNLTNIMETETAPATRDIVKKLLQNDLIQTEE